MLHTNKVFRFESRSLGQCTFDDGSLVGKGIPVESVYDAHRDNEDKIYLIKDKNDMLLAYRETLRAYILRWVRMLFFTALALLCAMIFIPLSCVLFCTVIVEGFTYCFELIGFPNGKMSDDEGSILYVKYNRIATVHNITVQL